MSRLRQQACPDRRERLIAVAAGEAQRDAAFDAHVAMCAGCRGFFERVGHQVSSLSNLVRRSAPSALDGLAVAATQAGFRQDRAVDALRSLSPAAMPSEVDLAIWPQDVQAPPILDRLVDRNLAEQTNGIARRFAGRLERLQAPRLLEGRVRAAYEIGRARRERTQRRFALLAAAVILVALGSVGTLIVVDRFSTERALPQIVIERVSSPAELDPALQQMFASLVGGTPDAENAVKEKL